VICFLCKSKAPTMSMWWGLLKLRLVDTTRGYDLMARV